MSIKRLPDELPVKYLPHTMIMGGPEEVMVEGRKDAVRVNGIIKANFFGQELESLQWLFDPRVQRRGETDEEYKARLMKDRRSATSPK